MNELMEDRGDDTSPCWPCVTAFVIIVSGRCCQIVNKGHPRSKGRSVIPSYMGRSLSDCTMTNEKVFVKIYDSERRNPKPVKHGVSTMPGLEFLT